MANCNHDWREVHDCDGNVKPYKICSKCKAGLMPPQKGSK